MLMTEDDEQIAVSWSFHGPDVQVQEDWAVEFTGPMANRPLFGLHVTGRGTKIEHTFEQLQLVDNPKELPPP